MLLPVPKFSKFLHGAALLFQHCCHNVPYWFLPGGRMLVPATSVHFPLAAAAGLRVVQPLKK